MAQLTFYGVRGSHPVSGAGFRRYGGHTACVALETGRGILVLDAGTGMAALGDELCRRSSIPPITVLFTHFHLDHLAGITGFRPFLERKARVTLMAHPGVFPAWKRALRTLGRKPFWPVNLLKSGAAVQLRPLPRGEGGAVLMGVRVSWCPVSHPQGCVSYRLAVEGREIVLATDREQGNRRMDAAFLRFCRGADVLIHDAQFTPAEHRRRAGWGHSTPETAARTAAEAEVGSLILTSHDPLRSDREVDGMENRARRIFRQTAAAREGMVLDVHGGIKR